MDLENKDLLEDLLAFFLENYPDDARIIRDAVKQDKSSEMFEALLNQYRMSTKNKSDVLLLGAKMRYFLNYCCNYDNGIPLVEIMTYSIDNDKGEIFLNACKSQGITLEYLIGKGVNINVFKKLLIDKEINELATGERKKSTTILSKNIERVKLDKPNRRKSKKKDKDQNVKELSDLFENKSKYKKVMLILAENKYIEPSSCIWIDRDKASKSTLCGFVKEFKAKGYFKPDIDFNWDICKTVCVNTFKVSIGSNKRFYAADLPDHLRILIPPAHTGRKKMKKS